MTGWKKWLVRGAGGLVALLLLGVGAIYVLSAIELGRRYEVPPAARTLPARAGTAREASAARGAHLARLFGCTDCHGEDLGGSVFVDDPMFGRLVAPNLTRLRETFSDADFERAVRHGIKPDGTSLLPGMPAASFAHMSDRDLRAVVAFVRSVPRVQDSLPSSRLALPMRAMLVFGQIHLTAAAIDDATPPRSSVDADDPVALGEYLARSACTECHGQDLRGQERFLVTPSLAVVAGYTPEQFRRFLRTGKALGGRELELMSPVARGRFSAFTDREIDALHAYLSTLARPEPTS